MNVPDVTLILLMFADSTIGVMSFVLDDHRGLVQVATDQNIQREIDRSAFTSTVLSWRRINKEEIPSDRTFRNAWVDGKDGVEVHMDKAREIQRTRLREARAPLLAGLDVDQLRAIVTGDADTTQAIEKQKQLLRDVTDDSSIDSAILPEELKDVWPEILLKQGVITPVEIKPIEILPAAVK